MVTRPALRWHGGKWRLAPWIIQHFGAHSVYVEPFGGAASVLLRKPRAKREVWNDLDSEVVTLFRVLRGPDRDKLVEALRWTPYAREEFEQAYEPTEDPVEVARRLVIRSFQGFGSDGHSRRQRTGFRANSMSTNTHPAMDWCSVPANLMQVAARFQGVVVEHRPALDVILRYDDCGALFYLDPPYLPATRSDKSRKAGGKYHAYSHEMSDEDHAELLQACVIVRGMVVLSGYDSDLYDDTLLAQGWRKRTWPARADGGRERSECLWLNGAASAAIGDNLIGGLIHVKDDA